MDQSIIQWKSEYKFEPLVAEGGTSTVPPHAIPNNNIKNIKLQNPAINDELLFIFPEEYLSLDNMIQIQISSPTGCIIHSETFALNSLFLRIPFKYSQKGVYYITVISKNTEINFKAVKI